jgi:hypothetical protein
MKLRLLLVLVLGTALGGLGLGCGPGGPKTDPNDTRPKIQPLPAPGQPGDTKKGAGPSPGAQ